VDPVMREDGSAVCSLEVRCPILTGSMMPDADLRLQFQAKHWVNKWRCDHVSG